MGKKYIIPCLLILLVGFVLVGCEEFSVTEPLTKGLYYTGSSGLNVFLLEVDEQGLQYEDYIPAEYFSVDGFAYHCGIAGSSWEIVPMCDSARAYLHQSGGPIKLYYHEEGDAFFIDSEKHVKEWLTIWEEADKYKEQVYVQTGARPGIIELTEIGAGVVADKSLIKSIELLPDSKTGIIRNDLVAVEGKELKLIKKNNHPVWAYIDVRVCLEKGVAKEIIYLRVTVAGIAPT